MSVSTTRLPFEQPAPDSPQERKRREEKVRALLGQAEDEAISRGYDTGLVTRLYGFVRPYRWKVLAAMIWMAATTMLAVSGPWIIGKAVDEGLRTGNMEALRYLDAYLRRNRHRRMVLQPPAHYDHGLCRHTCRRRLAQPALPPPACAVAQLPQQRERGPPDEPPDRRRRCAPGLRHLDDHRHRARHLLLGWRRHRYAPAQLGAGAGHLRHAAADDHPHQLLAQPRARGLPRHPLAPVADQRLSQRVDSGHPRHPKLPPRTPQHRPLRRHQPLLL